MAKFAILINELNIYAMKNEKELEISLGHKQVWNCIHPSHIHPQFL